MPQGHTVILMWTMFIILIIKSINVYKWDSIENTNASHQHLGSISYHTWFAL